MLDINKLFELRGKASYLREYMRVNPLPNMKPIDDLTWSTFWEISTKVITATLGKDPIPETELELIRAMAMAHGIQVEK